MLKRKSILFSALLSAVLLTGCVTNGGQKEMGGTLLGAGLGGLAGSQLGGGKGKLATVAIGALAGAMIGKNIGQSLDRADQAYMGEAQVAAYEAPVGDTISWNNPDSGNRGSVTPTRDGTDTRTGAYCREYQTTIFVNGQEEVAYGTSCRQPDGSWQIVP